MNVTRLNNVEAGQGLVCQIARALAPSAKHADRIIDLLKDAGRRYPEDRQEEALCLMMRRLQDAILFNRWP